MRWLDAVAVHKRVVTIAPHGGLSFLVTVATPVNDGLILAKSEAISYEQMSVTGGRVLDLTVTELHEKVRVEEHRRAEIARESS